MPKPYVKTAANDLSPSPMEQMKTFVASKVDAFKRENANHIDSDSVQLLVDRVLKRQISTLITSLISPVLHDIIVDDDDKLEKEWKVRLSTCLSDSGTDDNNPSRDYLFGSGEDGLAHKVVGNSILGPNVTPALVSADIFSQKELEDIWGYFNLDIQTMRAIQTSQNNGITVLDELKKITKQHFRLSDEFVHMLIRDWVDLICKHDLSVLILGEGEQVAVVKEKLLDGDEHHWRRVGIHDYLVALKEGIDTDKSINKESALRIIKSFFSKNNPALISSDGPLLVGIIIKLCQDDHLQAVEFLTSIGLEKEAVTLFKNHTVEIFGSDDAIKYLGTYDVKKYYDVLNTVICLDACQGELYKLLGDHTRAFLEQILLKDYGDDIVEKVRMAACFGDIDLIRSMVCNDDLFEFRGFDDKDPFFPLDQVISMVVGEFKKQPVNLDDIESLRLILDFFIKYEGQMHVLEHDVFIELVAQFIIADNVDTLKLIVDDLGFQGFGESHPLRDVTVGDGTYQVDSFLDLALTCHCPKAVDYILDQGGKKLLGRVAGQYLGYKLLKDGEFNTELTYEQISTVVGQVVSNGGNIHIPFIQQADSGHTLSLLDWAVSKDDDFHFELVQLLTGSDAKMRRFRSLDTPFFFAAVSGNQRALLHLVDLDGYPRAPANFKSFPEDVIERYKPIYQLYLIAGDIISTMSQLLPRGTINVTNRYPCQGAIYRALLKNYADDPDLNLELLEEDFGPRARASVVNAQRMMAIAYVVKKSVPVEYSTSCCGLFSRTPKYTFNKADVFDVVDKHLQAKRTFQCGDMLSTVVDHQSVGGAMDTKHDGIKL